MIRAENLVKTFGAFRAVDGFSFEVEPGEIYGLLGPNGAGKTTTTRILSCLLRPSSGTAWVAGYHIETQAHLVRANIGILTEVPGLYSRLTPREYLDFYAQVHSVPQRASRIEEMLHLVDMWDRRNTVMRAFSKGMQQRIAIARALIHDPAVLFFDEPTAALDPEAAKRVRDHLREIATGRGRSVLLCTHNLVEAEQLCDRLSIVRGGKQIAEGAPSQLRAGMPRPMRLRLKSLSGELAGALRMVPDVTDLVADPYEGSVCYQTSVPSRANPEVIRVAVMHGADVLALEESAPTLEEVYLTLVQSDPQGAPRSKPALNNVNGVARRR
jgi:ABC-2 type transport system ATP-binding protein